MSNILTGHGDNITASVYRASFKDGMSFACGMVGKQNGYISKPVEQTEWRNMCSSEKAVNTWDNSATR